MFVENFKASQEYFVFQNSCSLVGDYSANLLFLCYGRPGKIPDLYGTIISLKLGI